MELQCAVGFEFDPNMKVRFLILSSPSSIAATTGSALPATSEFPRPLPERRSTLSEAFPHCVSNAWSSIESLMTPMAVGS